ncbi:MAG: hypothetical protein HYV90_04385 [Candidatus Woesebacteria bacterium]|nr:MAG: hypothetical protein HYV90_04385 [Candidatus Woesebacteria bacterium]
MKETINQKVESIHEEVRRRDIEKFTRTMVSLVAKVNVFGSDENDEFKVVRENGLTQGIFKTWAVPVIPFLESGSIEELASSLTKGGPFWERLDNRQLNIITDWSKELSSKPLKLWQSLEKWRGFAETYDRRLQLIFSERELPTQKDERAAELILRLITAFGFASPFYHIEAMVGDTQNTRLNPISATKNNTERSGGGLDLVAMSLPSALKNKVVAKKLDWSGLNWEKIDNRSKIDSKDKESILTFRIAKILGVDIGDVIFAANALQWIPVSVGGKAEDLPHDDARILVENSLKPNKNTNTETVGRNMNALIRFLNWFPLVKNSKNFSGKEWRYAAACDTSDTLLAEVNAGGVLSKSFELTFKQDLATQVKQLDATSAKGRFLIQLLNDGKLNTEIYQEVKARSPEFFKDVSSKLAALEKSEAVLDVNQAKPRHLVGGKSAGLREAGLIFGKENVIPGIVITSETVENWLKTLPNIWTEIQNINSAKNISEKLTIAHKISELLRKTEFPINNFLDSSSFFRSRLAVRSSSFDEDTDYNGSAAGIYESEVNIDPAEVKSAISRVISSFFSDKAISYRHMQGLSDIPMFAVVISPFVEGRGGAAFSSGDNNGWEIVTADKPSDVVGSSSEKFDSYKKIGQSVNKVNNHGWVKDSQVNKIGEMLIKAEKIIGGRVDMEFAIDSNDKVWVLQLRTIKEEMAKIDHQKHKPLFALKLNKLEDLEKTVVDANKNIKLIIGENINIDQFQGTLFRWLTINHNHVGQISLSQRIPRTSHFANLCINLGIDLLFEEHG